MGHAELYLDQYVAPDGGGKGSPKDIQDPYPGCTLNTTINENPILFLVQTAIELLKYEHGFTLEFKKKFETHMASTVVNGIEGLHSRRCGDWTIRRQSHDNVVAMVIGSWYFGSDYAEKIFQYASRVGWNYNVLKAYEFDFKSQMQGGDIALCHYVTGRTPPIWDSVWLAVGLAISKTWNLADLRLYFLETAMPTLQPAHQLILKIGIWVHKKRRGSRLKWIQDYYGATHPFRMTVEEHEK